MGDFSKEVKSCSELFLKVLKKDYLNFRGTAEKKEFAVFTITCTVVYLLLSALSLLNGVVGVIFTLLGLVAFALTIVPFVGITIRRLRKVKLPVLLALLLIFFPVGEIALIIVLLLKD
ncbi:MAG: DUF805 domain-containing protein [Clostridiales bacterium]|nr:DUF805 domain-containing protein [Clostridiales bacterium]